MKKRSEVADEDHGPVDLIEAEKIGAETDAQKPVARMLFDSANRPVSVDLEPGFEQIVESIHLDDIKGTYDKLEKALRVGEKRTNRAVLLKRLDESQTYARLAHKLWMNAKAAFTAWELDNEAVWSAMWSEANRALQEEKAQGQRSKQITDADVKAMVASIYPAEYKHQEVKRVRVKGMVSDCEHLTEMWNQRISTVRVMYEKAR